MVPPLRYVLCVVLLVLYHYTINNDYTWYYIRSVWFLDIVISTCIQLSLGDIITAVLWLFLFLSDDQYQPLPTTVGISLLQNWKSSFSLIIMLALLMGSLCLLDFLTYSPWNLHDIIIKEFSYPNIIGCHWSFMYTGTWIVYECSFYGLYPWKFNISKHFHGKCLVV